MENLLAKLDTVVKRHAELTDLVSQSEIITDQKRFVELTKELSELDHIVTKYRKYNTVQEAVREARAILKDDTDHELRAMAKEELTQNESILATYENELKTLLLPRDPAHEKDAIMEIRAGTGGEEAALFVADLHRMYSRFIERKGWRQEELSVTFASAGGLKEVIFEVHGKGAYGDLWFESGVHRVQRIPATESSGRLHTSAATVAVLPVAEEIDIVIDPGDLQIDVFRSTGPGGQSVNTTDSAVRVTHRPTGLIVTCQDEKSQHKNKAKALKVLRSRLLDRRRQEEHEKITVERRSMVGTGDRSAKIRTYNFPQGRVTDHRIGFSSYRLDEILDGDLKEFIEQLQISYQAERLQAAATEAKQGNG